MVLLHLLLVVAVVFGVNLLPVFGPPTWALLVFFRFRYPEIPAPALIVAGAVAAASGRLLLALAPRALVAKLPAKLQARLQVLGHAIADSRAVLPQSRQGVTPGQAVPRARLRGTKPSGGRSPGGDHDADDRLAVNAGAGRAGQARQLQGADSEDDRGGEEEREAGHTFAVEPAPQAADHPHAGAAEPAGQGGDLEQPT